MWVCGVCAPRCLERSLIYPPENPFFCHYTNANNDSFVIQCCNGYDLCNKELTPALHVRSSGRFHLCVCMFLLILIECSFQLMMTNKQVALYKSWTLKIKPLYKDEFLSVGGPIHYLCAMHGIGPSTVLLYKYSVLVEGRYSAYLAPLAMWPTSTLYQWHSKLYCRGSG